LVLSFVESFFWALLVDVDDVLLCASSWLFSAVDAVVVWLGCLVGCAFGAPLSLFSQRLFLSLFTHIS
jgi:hypothetical protein